MSTTVSQRPTDLQLAPAEPAAMSRITPRELVAISLACLVSLVLGAVALSSVLIGGDWLGSCILVIIGVVTICTALTAVRTPLFFIPIAAGAGLLALMTALYGHDGTWIFIPNATSLESLRTLLTAGQQDVNQYAPPVPVTPGLACLIAVSLGAVAALVYLLTINLRLPTWACIPLLTLYAVPAFVVDGGAPLWAFILIVIACLILLATDQRVFVSLWGRSVSTSNASTSGLSFAAIRIGTVSLILAVLGSLVLPGLSDSALNWFNAQHAINAPAGNDPDPTQPIALDPLVSMRRQLLNQPNGVMFTYKTDNPTPGYLRTAVLTAYNGESFYPLVAGSGVNPTSPEGIALQDLFRGSPIWSYQFTDKQLASPYLPVPEGFFDLQNSSPGWLIDPGTLQVSGANTRGESWNVSTSAQAPSPADMRATPNLAADEQKNLLTGVPQPLIDQAKILTKNSQSKYDAAIAIQQWLRSSFTYSTDVKSDESSSYLSQFLKDRKGYCEQFAATMALMSRAIGIPSRVIVGFTAGTKQSDGTWSVSPHQAHAWPELFLGQWVRFEPTPRAQVDGSGVTVPSWSVPQAIVTPATKPGTQTKTTARNRRDQELGRDKATNRRPIDLNRGTTSDSAPSPDRWRWVLLLLSGIIAAGAALAPAVRRWWRRRTRLSRGDINGAWDELRDTMHDIGATWSDADTPRQVAANMIGVQHLQGDAAQAAQRLCQTAELTRYSPRAPRIGRVSQDVRTVRRALLTRMDRGTRVRATLRPASVVTSRKQDYPTA